MATNNRGRSTNVVTVVRSKEDIPMVASGRGRVRRARLANIRRAAAGLELIEVKFVAWPPLGVRDLPPDVLVRTAPDPARFSTLKQVLFLALRKKETTNNRGRSTSGAAAVPYYPGTPAKEAARHLRLTVTRYIESPRAASSRQPVTPSEVAALNAVVAQIRGQASE